MTAEVTQLQALASTADSCQLFVVVQTTGQLRQSGERQLVLAV